MSVTNAPTERILILGTNPLSWKIAEIIASLPLGSAIVGFVHDDYNTGGVLPRSQTVIRGSGFSASPWPGNGNGGNGHKGHSNGESNGATYSFPIVGPLDRLDNTIKDLRPDRIVVPFSEDAKLPAQTLLNSRIKGLVVEDGHEFYERLAKKLAIENLPPSLLIFSKDLERARFYRAVRRALNLLCAATALAAAAPIMLFIALAIKLDSAGPVFFLQEREGYRRRPFEVLKFRTMHPAPEDEAGWERDLTSRLTRVGKWLRRYHLDELPQLLNVIRGEMDVVGPRPEMACNVRAMSETIPYYSLRTIIRPGITGWAQIKNGYSVTQIEVAEKIRYDLYYIKHMSFWFDIKIVFATFKLVFLRS